MGALSFGAPLQDPTTQTEKVALLELEEFRLAAEYYERGQWRESAESFQRFLEQYPTSPEVAPAFFHMGESYLQLDQLRQARSAYQSLILSFPGHPLQERATFRLAEVLYRSRDPQATRMLESFLSAYPLSEWRDYGWLYLGSRLREQKEQVAALRAFEQALREFPEGRLANDFRFGLACTLLEVGESDQAIRYFELLSKQSEDRLGRQSRLKLASLFLEKGNLERAQLLIKEVDNPDNGNPEDFATTHLLMANCYLKQGAWANAVDEFQICVPKLPEDAQLAAQYDWAIASSKLGNWNQVTELTQRIIENSPDHALAANAFGLWSLAQFQLRNYQELWVAIQDLPSDRDHWFQQAQVLELAGRSAYELNDYVNAKRCFDELLSRPETISQDQRLVAHYFLAAASLGMENAEECQRILQQVALEEIPKENLAAWQLLQGLCAQRLGHDSEAKRAFELSLASSPSDSEAARSRLGLLEVLIRQGDLTEAVRIVDSQAQLSSDSFTTNLVLELGNLAFRKREYSVAARFYQRLVESQGTHLMVAQGLVGLGWVALEQQQFSLAKERFDKLLTAYPDYPDRGEIHLALAKACEEQGHWKEAASHYGRVADSDLEKKIEALARFKQAISLRKTNELEDAYTARTILKNLLLDSAAEYPRDYALYELAWLEIRSGDAQAGRTHLQEFVSTYPESNLWPDATLRLAQDHFRQQEMDRAQELVTRLLTKDLVPEIRNQVYFLQGQLTIQEKAWAEVESWMSKVVDQNEPGELPNSARYWRGESHYQRNQFSQAERDFNALVENSADLPANLAPWVWMRLGQCLAHRNAWEQVLEIAQISQKNFPSFEMAYEFRFLQGRAEFAKGELDQAIESFQFVIDTPQASKSETSAQCQWRIGEALFLQEKFAQAITAYYRVDSLYDHPHWKAAAMLQAGKCQEKLRNYRQAMILYNSLVKRYPNSEFAEQARKRLSVLERQVKLDPRDPQRLR